jgi:hypothetical protein
MKTNNIDRIGSCTVEARAAYLRMQAAGDEETELCLVKAVVDATEKAPAAMNIIDCLGRDGLMEAMGKAVAALVKQTAEIIDAQ